MPYPFRVLGPLSGGVHLGIAPNRLPPQLSPRLQNIRIRDGIISKRPGMSDFNGASALAGTPVSIFEYRRETGVVETVVLTGGAALANRRIYKSSGGAWSDISDATITNGDGTTDLQGTALEPYDATVAPNATQTDVLYMSNGNTAASPLNPEIIKWTGSGNATAMTAGPGSARYLATFANRLVLGYVNDTGTGNIRGNRVAWSSDGDAETWSGGGSGAVDLVETSDNITRLLPLRGRLIIYKQRSIFMGRETGLSTIPIGFSLVSKDIGTEAGFSVASAGDRHFFLGDDNVFEFDGATSRAIGDPIRRDLKLINAAAFRQIYAIVDKRNSEYWLFVPEGGESYPTHAWVYNYAENHWSRWQFSAVTCISRGVAGSAITWATVPGTWNDYASKTWEEFNISGAPTILAGRTDLTVDQVSDTTLSDGTSSIDAFWESRDEDFQGEQGVLNVPLMTSDKKTLTRIKLRYGGTGQAASLTCDVSLDGGTSFQSTSPSPATLSPTGGVAVFDTWLTSDRFRIRFRNNTLGQGLPNLQEIGLQYYPQAEV